MPALVSVCCITYNHAKFVRKAIDSMLAQNTTFDVEIVIGEDCSTDGTKDIVNDYKKTYPNKVRIIDSESNVGMMRNFSRTLNACEGKYIAILEGDDFWTDNSKLQKQVEFLEKNPEYAITYHKIALLGFDSDEIIGHWPPQARSSSTIEELAIGNLVPTLSCVFRNNIKGNIPDWFTSVPLGDYSLHMLMARHGKIKYFPQTMATYRQHSTGEYSKLTKLHQSRQLFDTIQIIKQEFEGEILRNLEMQQFKALINVIKHAEPDYKKRFAENSTENLFQLLENLWPDISSNFSFTQSKIGSTALKAQSFLDAVRSSGK